MIERTGRRAPRRPPSERWWLVCAHRTGGFEPFIIMGCCEAALAVFSFREEAEMFLRLGDLADGAWRIRESRTGELISTLAGPCKDVRRVVLDPLPEMLVDGTARFVSVDRDRFLGFLLSGSWGFERNGHAEPARGRPGAPRTEPTIKQGSSWPAGARVPARGPAKDPSQALEKRLRTVIEQSPLAMHVFAADGTSLLANAAWDELWCLSDGESSEGKNVFEDEQVRASGLIPFVRDALGGAQVVTPPMFYEPARAGRADDPKWLRAFAYPVREAADPRVADGGRRVSEVTLIIEDVTERKELEDRLAYHAFHDDLTGLANRALLLDRVGHAIERTRRGGAGGEQRVALLFLDLDNFKYVNDTLGHGAGDVLLAEVARRLRACARPQDTVSRLGGDEFVVLLEDVASERDAAAAAARIAAALRPPLRLNERELFVTASVGGVLAHPDDARHEADHAPTRTPADLLRAADVAMYQAKVSGKDRCCFFDPSMDGFAEERLTLEAGLRRAVRRGEFEVYYQPLLGIESNATVGYEALVRWRHPDRGLLPPSRFIPLAEETGIILEIGRHVLAEACAWSSRRQGSREDEDPATVWVNLSARQLREPDLLETIGSTLSACGLDQRPGSLGVEITESVAMDNQGFSVERTARLLGQLSDLGVRIAIDDFGTGYSSLAYLKRLPIDVIKIDRSFVSGLGHSVDAAGDRAIVSAVVKLAREMGLVTVGEGVETEEQLARLRDCGCDVAQGFLLAMPLPATTLPPQTAP